MRIVLSIVGVLVTLMGVVWFLQGINILLGSFVKVFCQAAGHTCM